MSKNKTDIELMYEGFFETCHKVGMSMGAEGALGIIALNGEFQVPHATKDGVSISRQVFFKNKYKNIGAFFAKQATVKTLAKVGDSTTGTLVFASAIVKNTRKKNKYFYNSKVREGIQTAQKEFEKILTDVSLPTTENMIYSVAKISSNNDDEIAKLVTDAYTAVGTEGVVNVEEDSDSSRMSLKVTEGMLLKKGWRSSFLCDQKTGVWEKENVNILIFEGTISMINSQEIATFISQKSNEPILIICEHISEDIITNIEENSRRGVLDICVIESPFYAEQRKAVLQDIALYSETDVYIYGTSETMKWGKASKIIVDNETTSIIQNISTPQVKEKITELKGYLETTADKDFFQKRITQLEGKAAIIKVGGITDASRKEAFDRVDDSVSAVKSAKQEGVISGGGSGLVFIMNKMEQTFADQDVQMGYDAVKNALSAPFKTVLGNAKVKYKLFIDAAKEGKGYNLKTHEIEDLIQSGVIDSAKSLRVALENAISVSLLLLNTKVIITN